MMACTERTCSATELEDTMNSNLGSQAAQCAPAGAGHIILQATQVTGKSAQWYHRAGLPFRQRPAVPPGCSVVDVGGHRTGIGTQRQQMGHDQALFLEYRPVQRIEAATIRFVGVETGGEQLVEHRQMAQRGGQ